MGTKVQLTYQQFQSMQAAKRTTGTVYWLLDRYIAEMNGTNGQRAVKPLGESHECILRAIQRRPTAWKLATDLRRQDIVDLARELAKDRSPATVMQYISYLGGALKYAGSAWDDCEEVTAESVTAAKPFLQKNGFIGKSVPRKRVPTDDEIERLIAYFEGQKRRTIPMPEIIAFALVSTRRLGEIARIRWDDIDWNRVTDGQPTPMYMVRDLKHPTKKKGNDKWFPLLPELAEIIRMQQRLDPNDSTECVFKFNTHSASAAYTTARHRLGITGLRFHDSRRRAITMWLARLKSPHKVKQISGHDTTMILERVYDASDGVSLHADVAKLAAEVQ